MPNLSGKDSMPGGKLRHSLGCGGDEQVRKAI